MSGHSNVKAARCSLCRLFQKGIIRAWPMVRGPHGTPSPAQAACRMNEPGHRVKGVECVSRSSMRGRCPVSYPSRSTGVCHQAAPLLVQWPPTHCFRNPHTYTKRTYTSIPTTSPPTYTSSP